MTPEQRLRLLELEKEKRRRAAPAALTASESETGDDDGEGEGEGFLERKSREVDDFTRVARGSDKDSSTMLARGMTLGLDDIAAGLGAKAGSLAGGETWDESSNAYKEGVTERRQSVADAKGRLGGIGTALEIGGALATAPVGAAAAIGKGAARFVLPTAAMGAIGGVGFGDSDTLESGLKDAVGGAVIGNVARVAAPVVGKVVGSLAGKAKDVAASAIGRIGNRADELRVLTTMGATGGVIAAPKVLKQAAKFPGGVSALAEKFRSSGISKGVTTTEAINARAKGLFSSSQDDIGRFIDDATDAGGFVDTKALSARLRDLSAKVSSGLEGSTSISKAHARKLSAYADDIERIAPASATAREIKDYSIAIGKEGEEAYAASVAGRPTTGSQEAIKVARREVEGTIGPMLDDLGMDSAAYQGAKTLNQTSRIAGDASDISLGRADKNNMFGLGDILVSGEVAKASQNPLAGIAALVGRKTIGPYASSLRATGAETARDLSTRLLASPAFAKQAGAAAEKLARAARISPAVLAKTHDELMATDPKYRQAVKDQEFRDTLR